MSLPPEDGPRRELEARLAQLAAEEARAALEREGELRRLVPDAVESVRQLLAELARAVESAGPEAGLAALEAGGSSREVRAAELAGVERAMNEAPPPATIERAIAAARPCFDLARRLSRREADFDLVGPTARGELGVRHLADIERATSVKALGGLLERMLRELEALDRWARMEPPTRVALPRPAPATTAATPSPPEPTAKRERIVLDALRGGGRVKERALDDALEAAGLARRARAVIDRLRKAGWRIDAPPADSEEVGYRLDQ
jgi:hypothetical protein